MAASRSWIWACYPSRVRDTPASDPRQSGQSSDPVARISRFPTTTLATTYHRVEPALAEASGAPAPTTALRDWVHFGSGFPGIRVVSANARTHYTALHRQSLVLICLPSRRTVGAG